MYPAKLVVTIVYSILLAGGFTVGARQIWQGFKAPKELVNPLFGNRWAIRMFTLHIVVVSADLFVIGPLALADKSTLLYWGGAIALFTSSLPLATYFDRNSQSFGKFIGRWVIFRNFFEYTLHIVFAALALSWFRYYLLLWWIVAYRYLDVGPRRLLRKLYDTPEKLALRKWAPMLNWTVITAIYVGAFVAVYNRYILFAHVPGTGATPFHSGRWAIGVVAGLNLALALITWLMSKWYTDSIATARATAASGAPAH